MSQRDSGYERKERDLYETPEWVTDCVVEYIDVNRDIWEPACGSGKMVRALTKHKMNVYGSDIETGEDFLRAICLPNRQTTAIVTNPPYAHSKEFIERSLRLTKPVTGVVAMLLRTDFDHAASRQHLFGGCDQLQYKIVLTKRIKWFEDSKGQPSFNHAWFVWNWQNAAPPEIAYAPKSRSTPASSQKGHASARTNAVRTVVLDTDDCVGSSLSSTHLGAPHD